jgi:hypothetical protein
MRVNVQELAKLFKLMAYFGVAIAILLAGILVALVFALESWLR